MKQRDGVIFCPIVGAGEGGGASMRETEGDELARQHDSLSEALRTYGDGYGQLARKFASSEGLHSTDALALIEILAAERQGTPLSPAQLSSRIGLTSGATSTLLNRLEEAGHIVRSRVNADRRIVTLHSTSSIQATADAFFDPLGARTSAVVARYSLETLAQFERLLLELHEVMRGYATEPIGVGSAEQR
ncbi:MAG: MarR family transcriptional regulator [Lysobacter sp.]|nr:MarR family transcriptional regulator [Lysobacter sp.]